MDQGVLQGLVDNGGAIIADNGAVYLTAKAKDSLSKAVVNHTGVIEANRLTQNAKGEIILLGDMQVGTTTVSGILKAEGKNGVDGGFIETSAANVQIQNGTKVSTLSDGGKTGKWLIDPTDFTISSGTADQTNSGIGAETLQSNLAGTDIELQTVSEGEESGDIHVNADVTWNAATTLTLTAHNNININKNITAQNGGLTLNAANNITATGNVNVDTFTLAQGNWLQNAPTLLPSFYAKDFRLNGGTFIRALGGDGSVATPWRLTDIYGVQGVGTKLNDNFELANDIDASGTVSWNGTSGFKPIGDFKYNSDTEIFEDNSFTGIFEGKNHTISNLNINAEEQQGYVGLFGLISGKEDLKAEINNLNLTNVAISGSAGSIFGGLVGGNFGGSISNSTVSGTISGSSYSVVGGLVGQNNSGSISNSTVSGTILGSGYAVGGLVGQNDSGSISNSTVSGTISGSSYAVVG